MVNCQQSADTVEESVRSRFVFVVTLRKVAKEELYEFTELQ